MNKYKDNLYTFIIYRSKHEFDICDRICILLVRLAQAGNICAKEKLINSFDEIILKWMEYHKLISRWKGNEEKMLEVFERCIHRYRYSGTFIGYLKRSLELQALALPKVKIISLNYVSKVTGKELHETLIQN